MPLTLPGPGFLPPAGRLTLHPEDLRSAAAHLEQASQEYDATGSSTPDPGTGAAAPLVALALGAHTGAGALLVSEARVLAVAIEQAGSQAELTDAQAALDLFDLAP